LGLAVVLLFAEAFLGEAPRRKGANVEVGPAPARRRGRDRVARGQRLKGAVP
jgi:hypothetical protein